MSSITAQSTEAPALGGGGCTGVVPASGFLYIRVSTAPSAGAGYSLFAGMRQTFTSTDVPKSIPDYTTVTSNLTVASGPSAISKVTVKLNITHTYDGDIGIFLKSPAGTEITLSYRHGSSGDNYTDTIFDDAAVTSIASGTAPFTGTYKPDGLLSTFNGQNANGTWTLRVYDYLSGYAGTLNGWSIDVY